MRYLLMANNDPALVGALSPEQMQAVMGRYLSFTQALGAAGVLGAFEQLHPADTATTVRNRDGETVLTDGPYADVAEQFGGYWVVEAPDLDTALAHARECPAADVGSVEVRGLAELG